MRKITLRRGVVFNLFDLFDLEPAALLPMWERFRLSEPEPTFYLDENRDTQIGLDGASLSFYFSRESQLFRHRFRD